MLLKTESNMETLTKENFWNEMIKEYPYTMEKFLLWVDQYKKDNNWEHLFNEGTIKFHDLPLAFQVGIFSEWEASLEMDFKGQVYNVKNYIMDALSRNEK